MGLYEQLQQRESQGTPLRVGLIGAGKFGTMFLAQVLRIPGIHVVGVADLRVDVAKSNMIYAGWAADRIEAASLDAALSSGETHVGPDAIALIAHHGVEILIECTGNPVIAVDHALAAFAAGKHVISATVEADAVCGAALVKRAEAAGVIYSQAYGDQPAMTVELVDWARTCGFEVAAAGRGHKWKPEYRFSTPDTIWDYWGVTAEKAERGRLNPKMFNSFLDGTKPAIESAAISNATWLNAPTHGLTYPSGAIDDIATLMRPRDAGGVLEEALVEERKKRQKARQEEEELKKEALELAREQLDLEEAREHAREAWAEDAKGRGSLSRKRWLDSIFELAGTCARHEDPASPCGARSLRS